MRGYHLALERAGIRHDPDLLVRGDFTFVSGVALSTRLLALHERPTAIFAASDEMAMGVLAVANQLGYAVPRDLAIAGFDDSPDSRMVFPALTTVHQPIEAIAKAAVRAATGRGEGEIAPLRYKLLCRGSTTGSRDLCLDSYYG